MCNNNCNNGDNMQSNYFRLIVAIAENKAARSTHSLETKRFWFEFTVLMLNTFAAILALFIGCPCKSNEKNCFYWVMVAICCSFVLVATFLNIVGEYLRIDEKSKEENKNREYNKCKNISYKTIDEKALHMNNCNEKIDLYVKDTKKVEEEKRRRRPLQAASIALMIVSTIFAITTAIVFFITK